VSSALQERQRAALNLALIVLAVSIGVYLLLQAALHSWRRATLVILVLPFAVSGSVLAAAVFGWGMTLGVVAGTMTVLGIALRNAMSLAHRYELAGEAMHARDEIKTLALATGDAALPVVATAVGTALLVSPFIVLSNVTGIEILKPFAIVVICGLVTSTALTLLLLPALYRRWGAWHVQQTPTEGEPS
jgi:Cu/Ag efflux pump CusA